MKHTERESNFELLRILCMLIIILSHYCVHSGFDTTAISNTFNKYFIMSSGLGKVGADCFILISGYFLVSGSFHAKKLFLLELETLCYSIGIGLLVFLVRPDTFSGTAAFSVCFPTLTGEYWFMSTYLLLYVLAPFLNYFLNNASQQLVERCIAVLFIIYFVIPTLTTYTIGSTSSISTYITLYMAGGYIHLYPARFSFFSMQMPNLLLTIGSYLFIVVSVIFFDYMPIQPYSYFTMDNSIPTTLCALGLFLTFKNMPRFYNQLINTLSSSTLGVYLLHDNPYVRQILWSRLLHTTSYAESPFLVFHALLTVVGIFLCCVAIDKVRILIVEKPILKMTKF